MTDERDKPEGGAEEEDVPGDDASAEGEERPTAAPPFDPISFAQEILRGKDDERDEDQEKDKDKDKDKDKKSAADKMPGSKSVSSAPPPSQRTPPRTGAVSVPPPAGGYWFEGPFSPGALQGPASLPQQPPPSTNPHTKATPAGGFRPPAPTYTDSEALEEARRKSLEAIHRRDTAGALAFVNTTVPSNPPPPNTKPAGAGGPERKESLSNLNAVDAEWADLEAATRPPPPGQNPEDFDIPSRREPSGVGNIAKLYDNHQKKTPVGNKAQNETTPKAPQVVLPSEKDDPPPSGKKTTPPPAPVEDPAFLERAKKKSIRQDVPPTEEEMNERVALGDYTGALAIAEKLLVDQPGNATIASVAENCRTVLRQMYITKIGPMDRVPMVMVPRDQLRWLSIDHRAGFVLSLVDGVSSLEMILDVSGMPELDALRILTELAQQRIISFR